MRGARGTWGDGKWVVLTKERRKEGLRGSTVGQWSGSTGLGEQSHHHWDKVVGVRGKGAVEPPPERKKGRDLECSVPVCEAVCLYVEPGRMSGFRFLIPDSVVPWFRGCAGRK